MDIINLRDLEAMTNLTQMEILMYVIKISEAMEKSWTSSMGNFCISEYEVIDFEGHCTMEGK